MSELARALLDDLAGDPVALARLRELLQPEREEDRSSSAPAYTVRSLAAELGRSERSVRAAIERGELQAVKRGRGWVIGADAVAVWATPARSRPRRSRRGSAPRSMRDAVAKLDGLDTPTGAR